MQDPGRKILFWHEFWQDSQLFLISFFSLAGLERNYDPTNANKEDIFKLIDIHPYFPITVDISFIVRLTPLTAKLAFKHPP
jgi:hypothetical protein